MCFLDINKQISKFTERQKNQNNQDNIKREDPSWRADTIQLQDSLQKAKQIDIDQRTNRHCNETEEFHGKI